MAIVQTLSKSSFIDAFKQSSRKDQFSYEALETIFDQLEEYSDHTGEPVEFDIVGICCDWAEADWQTIADDYSIDLADVEEEDKKEAVLQYLWDNTSAYEMSGDSIVYQQF